MSKFIDWLLTLDGRQVRALASQAGRKDWKTQDVDKLVGYLTKNGNAKKIWTTNYRNEENE